MSLSDIKPNLWDALRRDEFFRVVYDDMGEDEHLCNWCMPKDDLKNDFVRCYIK